MRVFALALCTSMLAACSGAGPQTIGNIPAPTAPNAPTTPASQHTFVNPTVQKVYNGIGSSHKYQYSVDQSVIDGSTSGQNDQLYAGNASTVRNTGITVDYNPRDAIFDISIKDTLSRVSTTDRFQDPIHRTNFGGAREPQTGIPELKLPGVQYLETGAIADMYLVDVFDPATGVSNTLAGALIPGKQIGTFESTTYFYQKPGTTTKYVTFAGYHKNILSISRDTKTNIDTHKYNLERGAFVFGENTKIENVPKSGSATFNGSMLATVVFDDRPDVIGANTSTYFQWIEGTSETKVDFLANKFSLTLAGSTYAPQLDISTADPATILSGAIFNANASGRIDLIAAGGFLGQFQQAWFVNPDGTRLNFNIAGSSVDGAFFGPAAQEVGGGYRIVGGTPDQRIDLLGVFVGK